MRRIPLSLAILSFAAMTFLPSCELLDTLLGGKDSQKPTVSIISPRAGAEVSGLLTIEAAAADDRSVFRVVFRIDNQIVGDDRSPPWTYAWDCDLASAGSHILVAEAWDQAGNYQTSAPVQVTVVGGLGGPWGEDFTGYPPGPTGSLEPSMPADASWAGMTLGGGSLDIVSDPAGGGRSPCLRLAQTTAAGDLALLFAPVSGAAKGRTSLSLYIEDGGALQLSLGSGDLNASRTAIFLWLVKKDGFTQAAWFASATTVQYGGAATTIGSGAWHELEILFDCGEALWAIYLDGTLLEGGLPMSSAFLGAPFESLEFLSIQTTPPDAAYAGGAFVVDDLGFTGDASVTVPPGDGGIPTIAGPSSLAATPGTGLISLAWTDSSTDEEGFLVIRSADPGFGTYDILDDLAPGTTAWTDATAKNGTTYYYSVAAHRTGAAGSIYGFSPAASAEALPAPVLGLAPGVYVAGSLGNKAVIWHDDGATTRVIELTDGSTASAAKDLCVDGNLLWATGYRTNSSGDTEAMRWRLDAEGNIGTTLLKASAGYGSSGNAITASGGQVYVAGEDWDVDPGICATLWTGGTMTHLSNLNAFSTGNAICLMDLVGPAVAGNLNDQFGLVYGTSGKIYAMDWLDDGSPGRLSGSSWDGRAYGIAAYGLDLYVAGSLRDLSYNRATYWIDDFSTMTPYMFGPAYVASEATAIIVESGTVWCAGSYQVEGSLYRAALWTGTGASLAKTDLPMPLAATRATGADLAREGAVSWVSGTWKNPAGANVPCYWTANGASLGRRDLGDGLTAATVGGIALVDPTPDYSLPPEPEPPSVPEPYPAGVTASGLVGFYPFSGNAADASGNGLNGFVDRASLATDRFGNADSAYAFDGLNSNISVQDHSALDLGIYLPSPNLRVPVAISAWIKPSDLSAGQRLPIVCKVRFDGTNWSGGGYFLWLDTSDGSVDLGFDILPEYGGTPDANFDGDAITAGSWSHVAISFMPWGNSVFYVNGAEIGRTADDPAGDGPWPLYFGLTNKASGSAERFEGSLDDIRIFNRELTGAEVLALYAEGGWGN